MKYRGKNNLKFIIYPLILVTSILFILGLSPMFVQHKVINTEYIIDNSAVVVDSAYMFRLPSKIKLSTKYGDTTVTSNYYYGYYKDKIGSKIHAKLEVKTYDNGKTDIKVEDIIPWDWVN